MAPSRPATNTYDLVLPLAGGPADVRWAELAAKRALDLVLGSLLLALAAPLLLLLALLVRASGPGPAFFWQTRVGRFGERFRMLKLRTMRADAESLEAQLAAARPGLFVKVHDDPRVTRIGRFLRRSSLDELPQLVNVVRGEMSLVGPRPLLVRDLERMPALRSRRRFLMPPGLTGLWQVSGRSLLSDEDRLRLDLEYVEGWSLGSDAAILLRTLPAVLSARGAV
jgi:lipopolysaccharide/colanic/teichoic acid biosynthesis glycosyltransferase